MKKFFSTLFLSALLTGTAFAQTTATTTTTTSTAAPASLFTPAQTQQIQQIIRDYLVKNPQVLVEASQALQQQQMAQMQKTAVKAIANDVKPLFDDPASPVVGNPNGNVTLIEFMDYQCAHCKEMAPVIDDIIASDSNLRVVYKELPIFGANSEFAAKAALASVKQGKYKEFHNALMKDQSPLTKAEVLKVAKSVGLNSEKLEKDAALPEYDAQIKANYKLAQDLGLMGTPALIVGKRDGNNASFIPGTTSKENLQQLIAQARK